MTQPLPENSDPKEAVRAELDRTLVNLGIEPSSPELLAEVFEHLSWGRLDDAEKALRLGRPDVPKDQVHDIIGRLYEQIPEVEGGRQCFLATAALGSPLCPAVAVLRSYRERVLRRRCHGRALIWLYEKLSPSLARWVARSETRRSRVARWVVDPAARHAKRRLEGGSL